MSSTQDSVSTSPYWTFRQNHKIIFHTGVVNKKVKYGALSLSALALSLLVISLLSLFNHGGLLHINALTFSLPLSYSFFGAAVLLLYVKAACCLYLFEKSKRLKASLRSTLLEKVSEATRKREQNQDPTREFFGIEEILHNTLSQEHEGIKTEAWTDKFLGKSYYAVSLSRHTQDNFECELHLFTSQKAKHSFTEHLTNKYKRFRAV